MRGGRSDPVFVRRAAASAHTGISAASRERARAFLVCARAQAYTVTWACAHIQMYAKIAFKAIAHPPPPPLRRRLRPSAYHVHTQRRAARKPTGYNRAHQIYSEMFARAINARSHHPPSPNRPMHAVQYPFLLYNAMVPYIVQPPPLPPTPRPHVALPTTTTAPPPLPSHCSAVCTFECITRRPRCASAHMSTHKSRNCISRGILLYHNVRMGGCVCVHANKHAGKHAVSSKSAHSTSMPPSAR